MRATITAETVTDDAIKAMMAWAYARRDYTVSVDCAKALAGDVEARKLVVKAINRSLRRT